MTVWVGMLMPVAAVDKDHFLSRTEDEIGFAREVFAMKPETVAEPVGYRPDKHFRVHIL